MTHAIAHRPRTSRLPTVLAVRGFALLAPDTDLAAALTAAGLPTPGAWAEPAPAPARAAEILGRKGLLTKNDATRLALCAAHLALDLPRGVRPVPELDESCGVVVGSGLGNADSVAALARQARDEGPGALSVLEAPNASCNVLATAVASRFGLGGPCVMHTSGAASGAHALASARLLLASGRASRVVLVGVEAGAAAGGRLWDSAGRRPHLSSLAGCVVLAPAPGPDDAPAPAVLDLAPGSENAATDPGLQLGSSTVAAQTVWGAGHGATLPALLALAAHLSVDDGHGLVQVLAPGLDLAITQVPT